LNSNIISSVRFDQLYSCENILHFNYKDDILGTNNLDYNGKCCTEYNYAPNGDSTSKSIMCFEKGTEDNENDVDICSIQNQQFRSSLYTSCIFLGILDLNRNFDDVLRVIYKTHAKGNNIILIILIIL